MSHQLNDSDLKTKPDGLTDLWRTLDKQRADAKTVTVDRKALLALLYDHATMAAALWPGWRGPVGHR